MKLSGDLPSASWCDAGFVRVVDRRVDGRGSVSVAARRRSLLFAVSQASPAAQSLARRRLAELLQLSTAPVPSTVIFGAAFFCVPCVSRTR